MLNRQNWKWPGVGVGIVLTAFAVKRAWKWLFEVRPRKVPDSLANATNPPSITGVVFLGTGSAFPTPALAYPAPGRRNTSALAVLLTTGNAVLVDCGEGTQHQIARSGCLKANRVSAILITHLHGDHVFGLFGLVLTMGAQGRTHPLLIVGPAGIRRLVLDTLQAQGGISRCFPIEFFELTSTPHTHDSVQGGTHPHCTIPIGHIVDGLVATAHPLHHTVPCFGFCLHEPARPGKLNAAKARALGASGRQLGMLKAGCDVVLATGDTVRSVDVMGPARVGRRVVVLQDTSDSSCAVHAAEGAELLIHESTFEGRLGARAAAYGHSTSAMAAHFAEQAGVHTLVLTHFSGRYATHGGVEGGGVAHLVEEAKKEAPSVQNVLAAEDLLHLNSRKSGLFRVARSPFPLASVEVMALEVTQDSPRA